MNEREHAEVGSSSAKGYLGCAGYTRETRPKPPHPNTVQGSRCHDCLETGDYSQLEDDIELTMVQFCTEYYEQFAPYTKVVQEEKVRVMFDEWFGYYDRLAFTDERTAHMFDWKFGYLPVEDAQVNPQGWFLAIGVFDRYPDLQDLWVHFVQPRIGRITRHKFNRAQDLERLKLLFLEAKGRHEDFEDAGRECIEEAEAMLIPTYENCKYCGFKARCPALITKAVRTYAALPERKKTKLVVPTKADAKVVENPAALSRMRDLADVLEEWAADTKWHTQQARTEKGIDIPGYTLVSRRGTTKIISPVHVMQAALEAGVTHEEIIACTDMRFAQIKQAVGRKAPKGKRSAAIRDFEERLLNESFIEEGSPSSYLKREETK